MHNTPIAKSAALAAPLIALLESPPLTSLVALRVREGRAAG